MIYYHTQWITLTSTKSALLYGQDLRVQIIELEKSQTCGFHAHYRVSLSSLNVHLDNNPYTQWSRCSLVKILGISCVALLDSGFQMMKPTLVSDEQPEWNMNLHHWRCFSGAKSCMALCKPMGCSTPGFLVLCYLLEFAQAHVHWGSDAIQPSHPLSPPSRLAFNLSQHQCSPHPPQWVSSSHQVAKRLELQLQHQSFNE